MNPIPLSLRTALTGDPDYRAGYCIFHNRTHPYNPPVRLEWHHNLIFAGRQVQARFCILQICKPIHEKANRPDVRERLDWIMLNRASDAELYDYSKAINLIHRRNMLNAKFGKYGQDKPRFDDVDNTQGENGLL